MKIIEYNVFMWFRLSEPLSICGESARSGRTVEVQRLAGFIDIHERLSFYRFLCWTISVQLNYPDWCKSNTIKNSYEVNGSVPTCDWLDWKSTSTTCSPSRPTRRSRLTASGKLDLRFERWFRNTFSWFNKERKHERNVFFFLRNCWAHAHRNADIVSGGWNRTVFAEHSHRKA